MIMVCACLCLFLSSFLPVYAHEGSAAEHFLLGLDNGISFGIGIGLAAGIAGTIFYLKRSKRS